MIRKETDSKFHSVYMDDRRTFVGLKHFWNYNVMEVFHWLLLGKGVHRCYLMAASGEALQIGHYINVLRGSRKGKYCQYPRTLKELW